MGLGKGLALELAKCKTYLTLCARSTDLLEQVKKDCLKLGALGVHVVSCDVTQKDQCKILVEEHIKTFQDLDILILNAGISGSIRFGDLKETDLKLFEKMMQVNFFGYLYVLFYALPYLQKSKQNVANIGVISSMSGRVGVPLRTSYCASKYAVNGLFDGLHFDYFCLHYFI